MGFRHQWEEKAGSIRRILTPRFRRLRRKPEAFPHPPVGEGKRRKVGRLCELAVLDVPRSETVPGLQI